MVYSHSEALAEESQCHHNFTNLAIHRAFALWMTAYSHSECNEESQSRRNVKEILRLKPLNDRKVRGEVDNKRRKAAFTLAEGATHVAHSNDSHKVAFTLAEVLITLGIIGVVAALTLPSIISKFQLKAFEVAFKKEYSVLNNTIDFLQFDENLDNCYLTYITCPTPENPNNGCYFSNSSDCFALKQGMIDKLKLTPITNYNVVYPKAAKVLADGGYAINKTVDYDSIVTESSAYLFPDGTVLMTITRPTWGMKHVLFMIDVNGKKAPNKWGYDVFFLTLTQNNGKLRLTDEYASLAQKGGRLPRTILLNKDTNNKNNSWHW